MKLFKGQNLLEFREYFQSNENCKEYLSKIKWVNGFSCVKCAHLGSQIRKDYSRTCNKCNHTETASAKTLFHKMKFGLGKAFFIFFEMSTTTKACQQVMLLHVLALLKKQQDYLCIKLERQ